jgi:hypothetical protein
MAQKNRNRSVWFVDGNEDYVKNLMKNMSLTMEQAMDALELSKEKKKIVSKTLQRVERRK